LNETTVRSTNDLKPWSSSDLSRTCPRLVPAMAPRTAGADHGTPPTRGCAMGEFGKAEGGNGLFTTAPSAQQLFSGGEQTRRPELRARGRHRGRRVGVLERVETLVHPSASHQLVMSPRLDELALVQHVDAIGVLDR